MKNLVSTWLLILCSCACHVQAGPPDKSLTDSLAIVDMIKVAINIREADSAIDFSKQILHKALRLQCSHLIFASYINIANRYFDHSKYSEGLSYIKRSFPYCTTPADRAEYYNKLGYGYVYSGDYVLASQNFYTTLQILELARVPEPKTAFVYNGLAEVNFRLGQYEKALALYNHCGLLALMDSDKELMSRVLINKAEFFTTIHRFDSAQVYLNKCIAFSDERHKPQSEKSHAYELLGRNLEESGHYASAEYYLRLALRLAMNRREFVVIDASFDLGKVLYHQGKYKEAEKIILPALAKAKAGKMADNVRGAYQTLLNVYTQTKQYKKAMAYSDSISYIRDSIVSAEKTEAVNELDLKYNIAEKDRQIAQSQLQIAHQNVKIAQKNIWILSTSGSVLVLILLSLVFYKNSRHRMRSMEQKHKINILKAAVQSEDNERSRIARELHDGVGGMLSAATMRFSALEPGISEQTPSYRKAMDILNEIGNEIRKTAHNLMPEVLLKQNLPDALRAYCNDIQTNSTFQITFQSYGCFDHLSDHLKLNVYRIVQELLKNTFQHAVATKVFVQLLSSDDVLTITVEDNGVGFDCCKTTTGIGLHNVRTRVSSLDGSYTLESAAGKGTSVFIEIRLNKEHYLKTNVTTKFP